MIVILEHGTHELKERWIGHPSIPLRMFGPKQYLMTPPIEMTKPKVTSKPKLVQKKTLSDAEDHQRIELMGVGHTRGLAKTDVVPINHFV